MLVIYVNVETPCFIDFAYDHVGLIHGIVVLDLQPLVGQENPPGCEKNIRKNDQFLVDPNLDRLSLMAMKFDSSGCSSGWLDTN